MKHLPGLTLAFLVLAAPAHSLVQRSDLLTRLEFWIQASLQHQPGELDEPARAISLWTRTELERTVPYIEAVLRLLGNPAQARLDRPEHQFDESEVKLMASLIARLLDNVRLAELVKRGSMLHTDIAMLADPRADAFSTRPDERPQTRPVGSMRQRVVVRAPDALYERVEYGGLHWDLARRLLDEISLPVVVDDFVSEWYRATAAYFAAEHLFGEAQPHLDRARKLLPNDAAIFNSSGCLYVVLAAPPVQHFVGATILPRGMSLDVPSARANRQLAENFLRRALDLDSTLVEARVRLGWVLAAVGRLDAALSELGRAEDEAKDPATRYDAALFRGFVEESRGHNQQARASYERAAELFPRAESARLAISTVSRTDADRPAAIATLIDLMTTPFESRVSDDPWKDFYRCDGRHKDVLLTSLRQQLVRKAPQ